MILCLKVTVQCIKGKWGRAACGERRGAALVFVRERIPEALGSSMFKNEENGKVIREYTLYNGGFRS